MYQNIGKKISGWAKFVCIIGIILSVLGGLLVAAISLVAKAGAGVVLGIFVALIGAVISWVSSLALYGFGELITKTDETNAALRKMVNE